MLLAATVLAISVLTVATVKPLKFLITLVLFPLGSHVFG
jgi:hypothetical protein